MKLLEWKVLLKETKLEFTCKMFQLGKTTTLHTISVCWTKIMELILVYLIDLLFIAMGLVVAASCCRDII